jgi:hypothetical protein
MPRLVPGYFKARSPKMETRKSGINGTERYSAQGYKDRDDYLTSLSQDFGIDMTAVRMISDMLGPSEDFDGLVSELEDFSSIGLFD